MEYVENVFFGYLLQKVIIIKNSEGIVKQVLNGDVQSKGIILVFNLLLL